MGRSEARKHGDAIRIGRNSLWGDRECGEKVLGVARATGGDEDKDGAGKWRLGSSGGWAQTMEEDEATPVMWMRRFERLGLKSSGLLPCRRQSEISVCLGPIPHFLVGGFRRCFHEVSSMLGVSLGLGEDLGKIPNLDLPDL